MGPLEQIQAEKMRCELNAAKPSIGAFQDKFTELIFASQSSNSFPKQFPRQPENF